jgi:two-component system cell cycle sensor histidine kinase/response regulator CckA
MTTPSTPENHRLLVIDDNRAIHDDFRKILSPEATASTTALDATAALLFAEPAAAAPQIRFEIDSAYQGQEGLMRVREALAAGRPYAMAFVDIRMPPGWDGVETVQKIWQVDPEIQIVLCTAYADYSWDEMFARIGNCDGLLILKKPFDTVEALQLAQALTEKWRLHQESRGKMRDLAGLVAARTRELRHSNETLQRQQAELRASEERFFGAFEYAPIGVGLVLPDGRLLKVNRALCDLVGYSEAELLTRTFQNLTHPEDLEADLGYAHRLITEDIRSYQMEKRYLHARGHHLTVLLHVSLVRDAAGQPLYFIAQIQDITGRKQLEARLLQSQKLETVGKLAGGIAHEFNSILTAIIGQAELVLADLPPGSLLTQNVTEISKAAARAAALTRQLLAYGRKQFLLPEVLDLNQVLTSMNGVFEHLMGGEVDIQIIPAPDLPAVKADAGQIEQVIMNMAINAREAMPKGGRLTLETASIFLDQDSVGRYQDLKPGAYVMLAISDTGSGMSPEVRARMFEPFFSTKGIGQGTGLGLSTCYGIIKQSGGHISVYSEVSRGTTFKIYLPQVAAAPKPASPRPDAQELPHGTETILLVEDDPALREMAATLLRRLGYTVLAAANGIEALSLKQQRNVGHVDLLFTDVVMPHMTGKELAERIQALYPPTKILFTSAYTENAIIHQGVLNKGMTLLQKPFSPSVLAHRVREVLDQPPAPKTEPV